MAYCLNDPIEDARALDLERAPLQEALVYDAGSDRTVPGKSKVLGNATDQKIDVLLLLLVQGLLRLIIHF